MKKTVYFVIDCSGSMYGPRADAVNIAMRKVVEEAIPEIKVRKVNDLELSFKVIGFSDAFPGGLEEIVPLTSLDEFNEWNDLLPEKFYGGTPTGAALESIILDIQGGKHGEPDADAVSPAIILISDGMPTDGQHYETVLKKAIKGDPTEVRQFRKSLRVAIGINVDEQGRSSLQTFGEVSKKMAGEGLKAYYDCSDSYLDDIAVILAKATIMASE